MYVIGSGISGLLAANMLRHRNPIVLERQAGLPNNHSSVLRFRSSVIGDVTGIPFRKVSVLKGTLSWRNAIADSLVYSDKNTGTYLSDRSIPLEMTQIERYIAPDDLIEQLARNMGIHFNHPWSLKDHINTSIVSTIPMPALMDILEYPGDRPEFKSIHGVNIKARIVDCDAYISLYVPSPHYPFSRISITGNELIVEIPRQDSADTELVYTASGMLGIPRDRILDVVVRRQNYAKILPVDDGLRKKFIAWASDKHNVYSLGRYGCWRPGLLLDDLVQDIRLIERWMYGGQYSMRKQR